MLRRIVPAPSGGHPMRRSFAAAFAALSLAVLPLPPRARAAISPEAGAVVRRYLEATGGAAAFAAESTAYTHARVDAFGFTGTFASWAARPARRYARTELGPFKLPDAVHAVTPCPPHPTTHPS